MTIERWHARMFTGNSFWVGEISRSAQFQVWSTVVWCSSFHQVATLNGWVLNIWLGNTLKAHLDKLKNCIIVLKRLSSVYGNMSFSKPPVYFKSFDSLQKYILVWEMSLVSHNKKLLVTTLKTYRWTVAEEILKHKYDIGKYTLS